MSPAIEIVQMFTRINLPIEVRKMGMWAYFYFINRNEIYCAIRSCFYIFIAIRLIWKLLATSIYFADQNIYRQKYFEGWESEWWLDDLGKVRVSRHGHQMAMKYSVRWRRKQEEAAKDETRNQCVSNQRWLDLSPTRRAQWKMYGSCVLNAE